MRSFQERYKIGKIFAYKSTYPMEIIEFWELVEWEGFKKCQNLLCQKLSKSFSFFFHWRIPILKHIFCFWYFLITLLLKWYPIFDSSPLHKFSKFNNFLWACWFLDKFFLILYPLLKKSTTCITIIKILPKKMLWAG